MNPTKTLIEAEMAWKGNNGTAVQDGSTLEEIRLTHVHVCPKIFIRKSSRIFWRDLVY